jgi:peptidoglycan/LPS O-acetylase OafA/YrhL
MSAAQKANVGLDVIRGAAALLVVLGHSRAYLGETQGTNLISADWQKAVLVPTSFAEEAVAVFFVLSGYLVGGSILRELANRKFHWRPYMAKRLSRLWTVLLPGIVITALVDALTRSLFPTIWGRVSANSADASTALCNAVFLQIARCDTYGSNSSLWSLSYEFWFYIIFAGAAVTAWGLARRDWRSSTIGLVICAVSLLAFGLGLLLLIPSWLIGVALAVVHDNWKQLGEPSWLSSFPKRHCLVLASLVLGAGMLASNFASPPDWVKFILVGLASAPLILLSAVAPWGSESRMAKWMAWIGTTSFSIYVFHLPVVKFWSTMLAAEGGLGDVGNVLAVYVLAAVSAALCLPLWFVTERQTHIVRNWMFRAAGIQSRPSPVLQPAHLPNVQERN